MAILTSKTKEKEKRNAKILKMYNSYMSEEGSQRFAVYEVIADKLGISAATVGRVIRKGGVK